MNNNNLDAKKHRKRIQFYKKIIVSGIVVFSALPLVLTLILFAKISDIEEKLEILGAMDEEVKTVAEATIVNRPVDKLYGTESEDIKKGDITNTKEYDNIYANEGKDIISPDTKRVYLTFDDGPGEYTGEVLDILSQNNIKATFFVVGKEEDKYQKYYKRIVDEGHTLGMHSYTHVYKDIYASIESFEADVQRLSDFLYEKTGVRSTVYRFPGGSSNSVSKVSIQELIGYLTEENIDYYDWNSLSEDAVSSNLSVDTLVENVMKDVRKNKDSVVLLHDLDSSHKTVESLQSLIDILKEEGYVILPIDENTPSIKHISPK